MEIRYPSDELAKAMLDLIFLKPYYNILFLIELYKKDRDDTTSIELGELIKIPIEEIFDKLKNTPLNHDVFNLNRYKPQEEVAKHFFFNDKISLEEKQFLVNTLSIRNKCLITSPDDDLLDFKLKVQLFPMEDLFLFKMYFAENEEAQKILEEINPTVFKLIKETECENRREWQKEFHHSLFEQFNHIAATFDLEKEIYDVNILRFEDYEMLEVCPFYEEYNIPVPDSKLYNYRENPEHKNQKWEDFYEKTIHVVYKSNASARYHIFNRVYDDICEKLQETYPQDEIVDIIKKIINDEIINKNELHKIQEFIKGFLEVDSRHVGQSYIEPYIPYCTAISETDEFKKTGINFPNFFNHIQKLIDKYHYQVFDNTYIVEPESENDLDKIWKIYLPKSKSDLEELTIYIKKDFSNEEIIDIIDKEIRRNLLMDKNKTLHISREYNDGKVSEINFFAINAKTPSFTAITVAEEIRREEKGKTEKENKNIETER